MPTNMIGPVRPRRIGFEESTFNLGPVDPNDPRLQVNQEEVSEYLDSPHYAPEPDRAGGQQFLNRGRQDTANMDQLALQRAAPNVLPNGQRYRSARDVDPNSMGYERDAEGRPMPEYGYSAPLGKVREQERSTRAQAEMSAKNPEAYPIDSRRHEQNIEENLSKLPTKVDPRAPLSPEAFQQQKDIREAGRTPQKSDVLSPEREDQLKRINADRANNKPVHSQKTIGEANQKLINIKLAKDQLEDIKKKWKGVKDTLSAGGIGQGYTPTPKGQAFDRAVDRMRNTVVGLTRIPGIGQMAVMETALTQGGMPKRGDYESVTEDQINGIDLLLNNLEYGYREIAGVDDPTKPSGDEKTALPPEAVSRLKEGVSTTFGNGQIWTLQGGKPTRVK